MTLGEAGFGRGPGRTVPQRETCRHPTGNRCDRCCTFKGIPFDSQRTSNPDERAVTIQPVQNKPENDQSSKPRDCVIRATRKLT
jgi:hypothetical protein